MNEIITVLSILLTGGVTGWFANQLYQKDKLRKTVGLLTVDGDGGNYQYHRVKLDGNEATVAGKTYVVQGEGRLTGMLGSLWLVHERHGWTLGVPKDQDTIHKNPGLLKLTWFNPETYRLAHSGKTGRKMLDTNREDDSLVKLAPFGLIALMLLLVGVGVIIYYVVKLYQAGVVPAGG